MTYPTFLSVSQVAAERNLPKRTIQYAINRGDLPAQKLPGATGAYLISPADLDAWLARRKTKASA